MRTTIAIRHVPFEDLGILEPLLVERDHTIEYRDAGIDRLDPTELAAADLVVVLGGPIGVYEADRYPFLTREVEAVGARLAEGRPTLGVCLGAQIMAVAAGAQVGSTGRQEIGYAPVSLTGVGRSTPLAHLDEIPVLHWHGDEFEIPAGAERLAETPGFPNQAFSLGPAILGLQFHLEADHRQIERWLVGHAHELSTSNHDPARIRNDAVEYGPALEKAAICVLGNWLDESA